MDVSGCPQPCLRHSSLALLLLIMGLAMGLPCHHLRTHNLGDTLQLLRDMAPSTIQPCHLQQPPFFPNTLRHNNLRPQQAAAAALLILQHLFHTLSRSSNRQLWHTQPRNDLLNKLQHYMDHLEQCLPNNASVLHKGPHNTLTAINQYFNRDIHLFLQAHNHSACAWEHVRLEALVCFQHVDRLTRRMEHQAALDPTKPTDTKHPSPASTSGHGLSGDSSSPGWDHSVPLTPLLTRMMS